MNLHKYSDTDIRMYLFGFKENRFKPDDRIFFSVRINVEIDI